MSSSSRCCQGLNREFIVRLALAWNAPSTSQPCKYLDVGCCYTVCSVYGALSQKLFKIPKEMWSIWSRTAGTAHLPCSARSGTKLLSSPSCPGIIMRVSPKARDDESRAPWDYQHISTSWVQCQSERVCPTTVCSPTPSPVSCPELPLRETHRHLSLCVSLMLNRRPF